MKTTDKVLGEQPVDGRGNGPGHYHGDPFVPRESDEFPGTPCDICGVDIFPRVTTRETGAHCLTHAVGEGFR